MSRHSSPLSSSTTINLKNHNHTSSLPSSSSLSPTLQQHDQELFNENNNNLNNNLNNNFENKKNDQNYLHKFLLFSFCFSFLCSGISISMIGPNLPSYINQLNSLQNTLQNTLQKKYTIEDLGIIFPSRGFGTMIGSLLGGFLIDFLLKKFNNFGNSINIFIPILFALFGIILQFLSKLNILFVNYLFQFSIIYLFVGLSHGIINVSSSSYLLSNNSKNSNNSKSDNVTFYFQLCNASFGIGAVLGPFLISLMKRMFINNDITINGNNNIVNNNGWIVSEVATTNAIFFVLFLLFVSFISYLFILFLLFKQHLNKNLNKNMPLFDKNSLKKNQQNYKIIILLIATSIILCSGAEHGFGGSLYSYLITTKLIDESTAGLMNSSFWFSFTFGRILSIILSYYKWKSHIILMMNFIGGLISCLLFVLFPKNLMVLWFSTMLFGLSLSSQYPTLLSFPSSYLNIKVSSFVTSLFIVSGGIGSMIVPYIMVSLFKNRGPTSIFNVLLIISILIAIIISYLIFGTKKKRKDPYVGGLIQSNDE
ncbi:hypothetical protein ABK040_009691 [Willaertia magna]